MVVGIACIYLLSSHFIPYFMLRTAKAVPPPALERMQNHGAFFLILW